MGFGVYVHVPFCAHRCDYCDFAAWDDRGHLMTAYVDACRAEIDQRRAQRPLPAATSVFFGGGTPSLLPPDRLAAILEAIETAPGAEITVECNPETVTPQLMEAYAAAGVTRVSLGMQSSRPGVLARLGRRHDPASVPAAVRAARAGGIARVNLDLIYGTPGESAGDWAASLRAALAMGPDHLSAYALSIEPGTPLGRRVRAGLMPPVDPDVQAARYEVADDLLTDAGFRWYEISSWARPGAECRHNLGTWLGEPYLGIGCAAHSHLDGRRSWNLRRPEDYLAAVTAGASPEAGGVVPDPRAAAEERFALALRTRWGAVCAPAAVGEAHRLAEAGLCTLVGTPDAPTVVLTRRGRLLATDVTARLCLAGAAARGRLPAPPLALDHLDC